MAAIYGQLVKAQLENLAADVSSPPTGIIYFNTVSALAKLYDGTAWRTYVTLDNTQTLTNKTITSGTLVTPLIDDYFDINEESAPSTPASGKVRVYAKSDGKLYRKDDGGNEFELGASSGSGSGKINYVSNGAFESDASGVSTYADAAAATPVDGTGGSPNVTATRNTSTPLHGLGDLLFAKDAANRQGQGFSIPVDPPPGYQYSLLGEISFLVDTLTDADYAAGDMGVYIYDITNGVLITPSTAAIPKMKGYHTVYWTQSAAASYRVIFHVATTNAAAYDVKFDDIIVGPGLAAQSPTVGRPTAWGTPTTVNLGTVTNDDLVFQQDGEFMIINGTLKVGTPSAALAALVLPNSLTINPDWHTDGRNVLGYIQQNSAAAGALSGGLIAVLFESSDPTALYFAALTNTTASDTTAIAENGNAVFNANATISFVNVRVAISQWVGAATNMINDNLALTNLRVQATNTSVGSTATATEITAVYDVEVIDTHNAYNPSTGVFTAPADGYYHVDARFGWDGSATTSIELDIRKNSTVVHRTEWIGGNYAAVSGLVKCVTGDTVDIRTSFVSGTTPRTPVDTANAQTLDIVRVPDFTAGQAVGFGLATATNAGLYKAGQAPGLTTGTTVAAGYIGEKITSGAMSTTAVASATYVDVTGASLTLTPGIWLIYANFLLRVDQAGGGLIACGLYDSSNVFQGGNATLDAADGDKAGRSFMVYKNISTSTTYKLRIASSGATSSLEVADQTAANDANDEFYAVRIG